MFTSFSHVNLPVKDVDQSIALRAEGETKLAGAAVRYALANPAVSTVILGFSKREYIDEANAYSDAGPLSAGQMERIDSLYAGGFGRAP